MSAPAPELTWRLLLAVFIGTALGSLLRWGAGELLLLSGIDGAALAATTAVNLLGSFCLGALLETLTRRQPHTPAARLRLLQRGLGTGLLGGFTTYSAFALGTTAPALSALLGGRLATVPEAAVSFGWALTGVFVTIVGGVAAAACGIGLAARLSGRHR